MAFFVKKQERCCYCVSLKTGTLIIVWLFLVCSVFELHSDIDTVSKVQSFFVQSTGNLSATFNTCMQWFIWTSIAISFVFHFIPYTLAMYGAYMRKATYLQPFILLNAVSIVNMMSILLMIMVTSLVVTYNRSGLEDDLTKFLEENRKNFDLDQFVENGDERVASMNIITGIAASCLFLFIGLSILTAIMYHLTCVVHSFYLKLKEEKGDYKYNMFDHLRIAPEKKEPLA